MKTNILKLTAILLIAAGFFSACEKEPESKISGLTFTPCKQTQQTKAKRNAPEDRVSVEFTNNGVHIIYNHFEVTCDFSTVDVTYTFVNGFLNITQQGLPNRADCVCYSDVSYTINGILQNEVNVIFINGEQVYCHNDNEQVQVNNITFTECINVGLYLPPAIYTVDFTNLGVNITHYLLTVNCAFDTVLVTHTFENGILTITEQSEPNSANCVCRANVSYTISGISENEVNVIFINGEQVYCHNNNGNANPLIGTWHQVWSSDNYNLITFSDNDTIYLFFPYYLNGNDYTEELKWTYQFISEDTIQIVRLEETNPYRRITNNRIVFYNSDSILIEKFHVSDAAVFPPLFIDTKFKKTR